MADKQGKVDGTADDHIEIKEDNMWEEIDIHTEWEGLSPEENAQLNQALKGGAAGDMAAGGQNMKGGAAGDMAAGGQNMKSPGTDCPRCG